MYLITRALVFDGWAASIFYFMPVLLLCFGGDG